MRLLSLKGLHSLLGPPRLGTESSELLSGPQASPRLLPLLSSLRTHSWRSRLSPGLHCRSDLSIPQYLFHFIPSCDQPEGSKNSKIFILRREERTYLGLRPMQYAPTQPFPKKPAWKYQPLCCPEDLGVGGGGRVHVLVEVIQRNKASRTEILHVYILFGVHHLNLYIYRQREKERNFL